MHLNFASFILYTQHGPCGMVGAKLGYVIVLLVHGMEVVEVGRKVFLGD